MLVDLTCHSVGASQGRLNLFLRNMLGEINERVCFPKHFTKRMGTLLGSDVAP